MAISKWIVDQMDGTIQVSSEPGHGSEFVVTVELPLTDGAAETHTLPEWSLLLVDDDAEVRESTADTLCELGVQVELASDGTTALAQIAQKNQLGQGYDAILLNCHIEGEDPAKTIRALRTSAESAALILLTFDQSEVEKQALATGASGLLSPPFFKSTLYHGLSRILSCQTVDSKDPALHELLEGVRILLAEDNELNREIAVELLTSNGLTVDTVEDGQQCLERFLASAPGYYQMILTDIQMPVMNGYESARQIRGSDHPDAKIIPILAVTADAFSEDIESAKSAGMDGHISKPIDIGQLLTEIKNKMVP